jgi:integrase
VNITNRRHFGSVRRLPSGRYQAAYWHEGKRRNAPYTFQTKADALAWLSVTEADILRGGWIDPAAGKVTFEKYAEAWRAAQVHRPETARQVEINLRRHVYPRIGSRPIAAIRPSEIQELVKSLPLAPTTVKVVYAWLSAIFKAAATDRAIPVSPCQRIHLPDVHERKAVPLLLETVGQLIEAIPGRYQALIVLGAGTGVRISEALGVTSDRVDWLRRTVTIDRQLVGVHPNGSPMFGPVKDKKNRPRTIPLPQVVVDYLAAHVAEFGLSADGLLFTNAKGRPVSESTWSKTWISAAGPLGIPSGNGYHQLRHFYASTLIRAGCSIKEIQERLGHTSAKMTLDVYSHLWPEDEDRTRSAVDAVLGRARGAHAAGGEL